MHIFLLSAKLIYPCNLLSYSILYDNGSQTVCHGTLVFREASPIVPWDLELNSKLQGRNENILASTDKSQGFMAKPTLWRKALERSSMDIFLLESAATHAATECAVYASYLQNLKGRFKHYFPHLCFRIPKHLPPRY